MVGTLALVAIIPMTTLASSQTPTKPAQRSLLSPDPFAFLEESSLDFYQNYLTTGFWFSPGWTFFPAPSSQPVVAMGPVESPAPEASSAPVPQRDGYFYESSSSESFLMTVVAGGSSSSETTEPAVVIAQNEPETPPLAGLQISPIAVTPKPRPIFIVPPPVNNQPVISLP